MKSLFTTLFAGALLVSSTTWAQTAPDADSVPAAPAPPAPPANEQLVDEQVDTDVRISSDGNSLKIKVRDEESNENVDIQVDLDGGISGMIAKRVIAKLEAEGLIDDEEFELTLQELEELEDKDFTISFSDNHGYHHEDEDMSAIAAIAILLFFGTPIIIVWLVVRAATRRKELMHKNIAMLIEQGKDIPPELMQAFEQQSTPKGNLHRGLRNFFIGLAIFISLGWMAGFAVGSLGLIPAMIGVSQLITWKMEQGSSSEAQA